MHRWRACASSRCKLSAESRGILLCCLPSKKLLPDELVVAIRTTLESASFTDGKLTAGDAVRQVKNNMQITESSPEIDKHRQAIVRALLGNDAFKLIALPKSMVPPIFNRYDVDMRYGDHVDNAVIGGFGDGVRADLSMTVFFSEPQGYDGGELIVNSDKAGRPIKLPAGSAVIYSSNTIHRIEPITRGTRYAGISRIQSLVRDEQQREILAELAELARWCRGQAPGSGEAMKVTKVRTNLIRTWSDV